MTGFPGALSLFFRALKAGMGAGSPFELNFAVTYRCCLRCRNCRIWEQPAQNELTLEEIQKLAGRLKNFSWLRLTGGEPFLRPDFPQIVKAFQAGMPDLYLLSTPTNGFNPELVLRQVKEMLPDLKSRYVVTVSLDGPPGVHDALRGVPESFARAMETYRQLKSLESAFPNFRVFFGYTIQPGNLGKFSSLLEEVKKDFPRLTADDFHVNLAQRSEVYYHNQEVEWEPDYAQEAAGEVKRILKMRSFSLSPVGLIEDLYLRLGLKYLKTGLCPLACKAPWLSCFITPQGEVYPCTGLNRSLGNLREADYDLNTVLNSPQAKEIAQAIFQGKCPQCWTPCEAHQLIASRFLGALLGALAKRP